MLDVTLGSLHLTGVDPATGVEWSVSEIDGWGATESTTSFTQRPRASGAWAGGGFAAARQVTLNGDLLAPTREAAAAAIAQLKAAVTLSDTILLVDEGLGPLSVPVRRTGAVLPKWKGERTASWSIQVGSTDWRMFGAPVAGDTKLPSTSGGLVLNSQVLTHAWTGAANASTSTESIGGAVQRTNLMQSPRGTAGTNYGAGALTTNVTLANPSPNGSTTAARITFGGSDTDAGVVPVGAVPAGATVHISGWVYLESGAINTVGWALPGIAAPTATYTPAVGQWVRVDQIHTNVASSAISPGLRGNSSAAGSMLMTDFLMEVTPQFGAFFDGASASSVVGGLTIPFSIDSTTVTGQVSLENDGNDNGRVTLRIDGPCTGPIVTHVSSGVELVFSSSLQLGAGEFLLVDAEKRTALANGQSSRAGYITSRGWPTFDPGSNVYAFTAAQYDPNSKLTVTGTPAWQ